MVLAYLFHNTFVFDNLVSYMMFFLILAYVHVRNVSESVQTSRFYTKTFSPYVSKFVIFPASIIVTALLIYMVNVPAISANKTLISAMSNQAEGPSKNLELFKKAYGYNSFGSTEVTEQLIQMTSQIPSQTQVDANTREQFFNFAKQKIEEKVAQTPHDARYLVFAGTFFNRFGQYDLGLDYLNKALVESPKKQSILFEMGTAYIGKQDTAKALASFKQAYELSTTSQESKIIYAVGALYARDVATIQKLLSEISQETIIFDNRFLSAYANIGDYQSVIAILTARIEKEPANKQHKLSLAYAYSTTGQKQKAIELIQAMIKEDPTFKEE